MQLDVAATVLDWCAPEPFYDSALDGDTAEAKEQEDGAVVARGLRERGFDLIIASDLLYNATEDTWPQLAATLATICSGGPPMIPTRQTAATTSEKEKAPRVCSRGTYRESQVLLGFQKRSSVSQHVSCHDCVYHNCLHNHRVICILLTHCPVIPSV